METQVLNLYIVDDNTSTLTALKQFLEDKFGRNLKIKTFRTGETCLEEVDKTTNIVILDYYLEGKNGLDTLRLIKLINPQTEVIMLSNNEDMAVAINTFRAGAKDYVIKGVSSWKRIGNLVTHIITEPIRILVREFGVSKFMAIFLLTFVTMGIVVYFVLRTMSEQG